MDKRREPRFVADQAVTITMLRDPENRMPARVKDSSGRGLGLELLSAVPPGTALKIEMEDSVILGEAVYCRKDKDTWFVGVELNQVLAGLAELGRRLQEFSVNVAATPTVNGLAEKR